MAKTRLSQERWRSIPGNQNSGMTGFSWLTKLRFRPEADTRRLREACRSSIRHVGPNPVRASRTASSQLSPAPASRLRGTAIACYRYQQGRNAMSLPAALKTGCLNALLASLLLTFMGQQSAHAEELSSWGHFQAAFRSGLVRVEVFEDSGSDGRWVFKRTTITGPSGSDKRTDWADSSVCPALTQSMDALAKIEWPVFATPANLAHLRQSGPDNGQITVVNDPNTYELSYGGFYQISGGASASVDIVAYDDSPLASWIHDTLSDVESCWTRGDVK